MSGGERRDGPGSEVPAGEVRPGLRPAAARIHASLRRHGLLRRPKAVRELVRAGLVRFCEGNAIELYETGAGALDAMLEAIRGAQTRIHFETYILRTDITGGRFLDALHERLRAGCEVRLLYDGVGSRGIDSARLAALGQAGADVVEFNPLRRVWPHFAPRRRDHRKLLVVDGRVAFTGGINVGDEYVRGLPPDFGGWRDAHARLEGPVVRDLEAVFLESWFRADGPHLHWDRVLRQSPERAGDQRCAVVPDGPVYRRRRMRDLIIDALAAAREHVALVSPYLAPGRRVLDALADASRRGVEIELVLAGRTDHPILRRGVRGVLPRLLDCGVHVYEYEASMLHAKLAIFDRGWAVLGTSNLDRQSLDHSYEVNIVFEGGDVPALLHDRFGRDLAGSQKIDRGTLDARSFTQRALDSIASLLLRVV